MSLTFRTNLLALAASLGLFACGGTDSPTLTSLAVTPATATVAIGHTVALTVAGTRSDGSAQAITDATWTSSVAGIATVSATGTVTGIAAGSATITAASSGLTATAVVTVTAPTVTSIAVAPATVTIAPGATQALTVTATLSDATTATVTSSASYASSSTATATVSVAGVITAVAAGTSTVTVTYQGKTATVAVTVSASAPTLSSIAVTPSPVNLAINGTQQLTVTGTFSDNSHQTVTNASTFSSATTSVATVSAIGLVTAVAAGSSVITVSDSGKTTTVTVNVTAATLSSIAVTPSPVNLNVGGTQALTVTGTFSDSSHANVTSNSTFVSDTTSVATVASTGVVSAVSPGSATITVSDSGKTTTVTVNVATPVLQSIAALPNPVSIAAGATAQLTVTGTFDAGPTRDLTASASFTSNDTTVATVSSSGLVTAVANGSTSIAVSVTPSGGTAVTTSVTVNVAAVVPDASVVFVERVQDVVDPHQFGARLAFDPFGGSTNDVSIDTTTTLDSNGHASIKLVYPASGFTGGSFVDPSGPRDLSAFDSVTFWAKASSAGTFEKVGLGNNAGFSAHNGFEVERPGIPVTTAWTRFTVPIPDPSKLTSNDGLFHFADGTNHAPFIVWLADIQYVNAGNLGTPTPAWNKTSVSVATGATYQIQAGDLAINYSLPADGPVTLQSANPNYFSFTSDNTSAATVSGSIVSNANTSASVATANITAKLETVSTANHLTVNAAGAGGPAAPTTLPPVPAQAAGPNVISLYSSVTGGYTGTASDKSGNVETWRTCWSGGAGGDVFPITVGAATAGPRKYVLTPGGGSFVGVEFIGKTGANPGDNCGGTIVGDKEIDVSTFDHFHIDIWTPDDTDNFQVQLVDAGNDKQVAGQATTGTATITQGTTPPLATGKWLSYDLALANGFPNGNWVSPPANLKQLAQMLFIAPNGGTIYVDNMYFYKSVSSGGGTSPTTVAPAPTAAANTVLSLFSSTYSGTAGDRSANVDSYSASCFGPPGTTVSDFTIPSTSHVVKQYGVPANSFAILELIGSTGGTPNPPDSPLCSGGTQTGTTELDAHTMSAVHFDIWSPAGSGNFQIHLVSADGTGFIAGPGAPGGSTGGQDFASGANTIATGTWVSFDVPLTQLGPPGAPGGLTKLALIKFFTTDAGTYYLDNLYFHQ